MKQVGQRSFREWRSQVLTQAGNLARSSEGVAVFAAGPLIQPMIAGTGASAEGPETLKQRLGALPTNTRAKFVLVRHLEPRHESLLTSLLTRATAMPVREVREGMWMEPNRD